MAWQAAELESVPCDLCGATQAPRVYLRPDGLQVALCAECGLMRWALLLNLLWAVVLMVSAWFLVSRGALGLACANTIAYGVHVISVSVFVLSALRGKMTAGTVRR